MVEKIESVEEVVSVTGCDFCKMPKGQNCINIISGDDKPIPHETRCISACRVLNADTCHLRREVTNATT